MKELSFKQRVGLFTVFMLLLTIVGCMEEALGFSMVTGVVFVVSLMVWGPADNTKPSKKHRRYPRNTYTPKL